MENQNLKFEQLEVAGKLENEYAVLLNGRQIGRIYFDEASCMYTANVNGGGHVFVLSRRQLDAVKNRIRDKFEE